MKLTLKAEVTRPSWLGPVAHLMISGAGLAYLQHAGADALTTAVTVGVAISYNQLLGRLSGLGVVSGEGQR